MGSNVIRLSRPVIYPEVREVRKVIPMPNLFTTILNLYKKKQDEIRQRKIKALKDAAYRYYFDLSVTNEELSKFYTPHGVIDLPPFIYKGKRIKFAEENASREVMRIVKENRVDECYRVLKKNLKNKRRGK